MAHSVIIKWVLVAAFGARLCCMLACFWLSVAAVLSVSARAGELPLDRVPVAGQTGPSCGFFANVPAVTLATGVDIYPSKSFMRSVYGLRRGDFRYQRSFDKRMFFELFSIPYQVVELEHEPQRAAALKPTLRKLVSEVFDPGLAAGKVYSLRVVGVFGGPHNALLFGKSGDRYVVHDPYPGRIKKLTVDGLVEFMMVRSTTKANRGKEVYVTHFLEVDVSDRAHGGLIPITRFPAELKLGLTPAQRQRLVSVLRSAAGKPGPAKLADRVHHFPDLDFAVLDDPDDGTKLRNVIGGELKPDELAGVLHLAKFTMNTWLLKRRPLLPVVFMEGRPWVMVGYEPQEEGAKDRPTLVFDDGREIRGFTVSRALDMIHADGACYGTIEVDWE